jgi:uncharacterized protein
MYFNVSQLLRESSGASRTYNLDGGEVTTYEGETVDVTGTAHLLKIDRGIWLSAKLDTEVSTQCSRCLSDTTEPVHMDIEEEYLPQIDPATGRSIVYTDEDYEGGFLIGLDHVLDVTEAVAQYLSMNAPMRPLCSPDCKGICMHCGANRNEQGCLCEEAPVDPRWGALLEVAHYSQSKN